MTKNLFTTIGEWTPARFSEVKIMMPLLTSNEEMTNNLTRANKPEARYWKGNVGILLLSD
jgi:hypothetical protein